MRLVPIAAAAVLLTAAGSLPVAAGNLRDANLRRARASLLASQPEASGVISSAVTSPDELIGALDVDPATVTGATTFGNAKQAAAFLTLGSGLTPTKGDSFAFLSTGVAGATTAQSLDSSETDIQWGGRSFSGSCPADFGDSSTTYHDCAGFSFAFVVPDGMHSIKFDFNFMSAEYPEFLNSDFNDSFEVKEQSTTNHYDNIVFGANGLPININSASFGEPCEDLPGSGFDIFDTGGCDAGATGILTTSAPVEPGESVTLRFMIGDGFDGIYDSAVLIDNLVLSTEMAPGPTTQSSVQIDWLSPKSGPIAGGTQVTIHGSGFTGVSAVRFGGTPALFQALDDTTVVAVTPSHSVGAVPVSITASPLGSASTGFKPNGFTYYDDPQNAPLAVESVDPPEGPLSGGVQVTVKGAGFTLDTVITIGGEPATDLQFIAGDQIIVKTPAGQGTADVRATNADGSSATLLGGYQYLGDGAAGSGAKLGGCSCELGSTGSPSGTAAGVALVGLAIAAWLVKRRGRAPRFLAASAALVLLAGCENKTGVAVVNAPPTADAGADQEAFAGDAVSLDGSGSHDFEHDSSSLTFAWSIVSRPAGSSAHLSDPSSKTPTFIADVPGLYRVGLVVTDANGTPSPEIGYGPHSDDELMNVVSLPFEDLQATLTWDTDLSDLDLHLVRGTVPADYWSSYADCFYGVPHPDWGSYGIRADNPVLDADADHGFGPEHIALPSPQDNGVYTILVHEFDAHGAGPTTAHVKLTINGTTVVDEDSPSTMDATDAVWVVGTIGWPEDSYSALDLMTTHQNLGGPAH